MKTTIESVQLRTPKGLDPGKLERFEGGVGLPRPSGAVRPVANGSLPGRSTWMWVFELGFLYEFLEQFGTEMTGIRIKSEIQLFLGNPR
jgi:hypothetical protein